MNAEKAGIEYSICQIQRMIYRRTEMKRATCFLSVLLTVFALTGCQTKKMTMEIKEKRINHILQKIQYNMCLKVKELMVKVIGY